MAAKEYMRLRRNIDRLTDGQVSVCDVDWDSGRLDHFRVVVSPNSGLYKGGQFVFRINLPENYPSETPPIVYCETQVYHPNIDPLMGGDCVQGSNVCVNVLDEGWTLSSGFESIVLGLLFLMHNPNFASTLNSDFCDRLSKERKYKRNIRKYMAGKKLKGKIVYRYKAEELDGDGKPKDFLDDDGKLNDEQNQICVLDYDGKLNNEENQTCGQDDDGKLNDEENQKCVLDDDGKLNEDENQKCVLDDDNNSKDCINKDISNKGPVNLKGIDNVVNDAPETDAICNDHEDIDADEDGRSKLGCDINPCVSEESELSHSDTCINTTGFSSQNMLEGENIPETGDGVENNQGKEDEVENDQGIDLTSIVIDIVSPSDSKYQRRYSQENGDCQAIEDSQECASELSSDSERENHTTERLDDNSVPDEVNTQLVAYDGGYILFGGDASELKELALANAANCKPGRLARIREFLASIQMCYGSRREYQV